MATLSILLLMDNKGISTLFPIVIKQIVFGLLVGTLLARFTILVIKKLKFEIKGFYPIFILAIAILSYSLSEILGGNGYLSVYMSGIIIGNSSQLPYKKSLFQYFDCI